MIVTLTPPELRIAALVGVERRIENLSLARHDRYGASPDDWTSHIEGAAAEMCLAKHLGVYWSGAVGNLRAKDVGRLQVRSTRHRDGCLLLHPKDDDVDVFVLAVGIAPTFSLVGWLRARDGKLAEFKRDPKGNRPAFFVPQQRLKPMSVAGPARARARPFAVGGYSRSAPGFAAR